MYNNHFSKVYPILVLFVLACTLPIAANSTIDEVVSEKHIRVAMRMIGHEMLICLGDSESRVMPIEKVDEQYKIPFEFKFGFDPDEVVSIVERVMTEAGIVSHYVVEVEQCETKNVVHSFEIGNNAYTHLIPCRGRVLPEDCYSILITIMDGISPVTKSSSGSYLASSEADEAGPYKSAYLVIPAILLIGFVGFMVKKRNYDEINPDLISIGASQFDKRKMSLSFENKVVELSSKESELLSVLHASANAPIEREVILQQVWGDDGDYVGRTLDVFISKLRKKLEADTSVKIVNIRGVGYKLVMDRPK